MKKTSGKLEREENQKETKTTKYVSIPAPRIAM